MSYAFLDAYGSVLTADASVVSGSDVRPIVQIGSVLSAVPVVFSGASSISGTVDIGTIPGSVVAFQGGVYRTSIVSTVPSSVLVGASIFGQLPAGTAPLGSVAVLQ